MDKLFWTIAIGIFGSALIMLSIKGHDATILDVRFWSLFVIGTLSAILGNFSMESAGHQVSRSD